MIRPRVVPALLTLGFLCAVPSTARATFITATLTADDTFQMYLSTDDSLTGTLICQAAGLWHTTTTCAPALLTPNTTNYLHIVASDIFGPPSMLIGSFGLTDALFQFSNGTQSLDTNAVNWVVRTTGFAGANQVPFDIGPNGTAPWGSRPGISTNARFIWDTQGGCNGCTRYFSTTITPTQAAPVPEPGTFVLIGSGAIAAIVARRRMSKRA